ncbi:MAG TPA: hypothetical protein VNC11_13955 [Gemmatimonadaceae bacterium]|jgi:hypothetical protein|nr:hypothetical protein [Gemmatimonadaceae bacterium]
MKQITSAAAIALFVSAFINVTPASAQRTNADVRARELAASFDKFKHVVKDKRGVRRDKYKDVRTEPVVRSNLQTLSGTYQEAGWPFSLRLRVDQNGRVEGTGEDPVQDGVMRPFTIANGRVSGALLTGTKVYGNGAKEPLEGVFINRIVKESPTDPGTTEFGLGMTGTFVYGGFSVERLFFPRVR